MEQFFPDEEYAQRIENIRSELNKYRFQVGSTFAEELEYQWVFDVRKCDTGEQDERGVFSMINAFMTLVDLAPFDVFGQMRIREVDEREARNILVYVLMEDLAYSGPTGMSRETSLGLVEQLLGLFTSGVRYFTNATFYSDPIRLSSWSPNAGARTFDTGVVLVDEQRIALLWATAED